MEFSAVWLVLFDRVVATLQRRGVDLASAEDAAQEAGARALAIQVAFTSENDLCRWLHTVAWRVAIDSRRRTARCSSEAVDVEAAIDVSSEVESRLRLGAVGRVLPLLSATDRAALLEQAAPAMSRQESVKLAVRRHRARSRLLALLEGLAAIVAVPWRRASRAVLPSAGLAAAVLVPLVVIWTPPFVEGSVPGDADGRTQIAVDELPSAAHPEADGTIAVSKRADALLASAAPILQILMAPGPAPDGTLVVPVPGGPGTNRGEVAVGPKKADDPIACAWNPTLGTLCTPDQDRQWPVPAVPKPPSLLSPSSRSASVEAASGNAAVASNVS